MLRSSASRLSRSISAWRSLRLAHEPVNLRAAVLRVARQRVDLTVAVRDVLREPLDLGVAGLGLAGETFDRVVALLDVAREPLDLRVAVLGVVRQPLDLLDLLLGLPPAAAHPSDEADRLLSPAIAFAREHTDLALTLGERVFGSRESRPLLLQLREEKRLGASICIGLVALNSTRMVFRLGRQRLHDAERRRAGHSTIVLVPPLDLRAQARPESGLHRELDAVLRRERAREIGTRHETERDDRLTEPLARHLLLNEGAFELVVGQKTLFDEQASKGTPGNAGRFHRLDIGAVGPGDKRYLTRCLFRVRSSG